MKTKIFALIISILCLSMIFVACDQECTEHSDADSNGVCDNCEAIIEKGTDATTAETEEETETDAPCDTHKDADADKVCDTCGKAVVTIIEYVSGEQAERVEMVVNGIPSTSADEYVDSTLQKNEFLSSDKSIKIEGTVVNRQYAPYIYTTETVTDEETLATTVTHKIIDISTVDAATGYFKVLWSGVDSITSEGPLTTQVEHDVTMGSGWYFVKKTTVVTTGESVTTIEAQAYTFANKALGKAQNPDPIFDSVVYPYDDKTVGTDSYVNYDGVTYVIDLDTFEIVNSGAYGTIADRIQVERVQGNYGYQLGEKNSLYVYDITKWNELVHIYTPESRYTDVQYFVLQNGNVLMTSYVRLPDGAVSYDYVQDGMKYDLVYIMINVAEKVAAPVEFGYKVDSLVPAVEGFTEAAANYNVATVYPVVDGYINTNIQYRLLVDNDLKVICELKNDGTLVANGLYVKDTKFFNGQSVSELIDVNGNHVDYIGNGWSVGYIQVGNKFYNYNNELVVDLGEYDGCQDYYGYYILTKNVNVAQEGEPEMIDEQIWIYVPGQPAPVRVEDNDGYISYNYGYYKVSYTVTETTAEGDVQATVTELYTLGGTKFFSVKNETVYDVEAILETIVVETSGGLYVVQ